MVTEVKGLVWESNSGRIWEKRIKSEVLDRNSDCGKYIETYTLGLGITVVIADREDGLGCLILRNSDKEAKKVYITVCGKHRESRTEPTVKIEGNQNLRVTAGKNFIEASWRPCPERR